MKTASVSLRNFAGYFAVKRFHHIKSYVDYAWGISRHIDRKKTLFKSIEPIHLGFDNLMQFNFEDTASNMNVLQKSYAILRNTEWSITFLAITP